MRIKSDLRESLEDLMDLLREKYPDHDPQELLAKALYRNLIRYELGGMFDFMIEEGEVDQVEKRKLRSAA